MLTVLIITIILSVLIISLINLSASLFPMKYRSKTTPKDFNLDYEEVSFRTKDGINLKGWFIPNKKTNKAIIISHGYIYDKGAVIQMTNFLAKYFNLLYFDFRYFGESQGNYTSIGYHEKKDFQASIEYLKNRKMKNIGALGFSFGAATILMTNSPDIKALIADSSYSDINNIIKQDYFIFPSFTKMPFVWLTKFYAYLFFGIRASKMSPLKDIQKINIPILLIHGEQDSIIRKNDGKLLYEASNKDKTELWIRNGDHKTNILDDGYKKNVIEFFKNNL